jgi:hypothetical protein
MFLAIPKGIFWRWAVAGRCHAAPWLNPPPTGRARPSGRIETAGKLSGICVLSAVFIAMAPICEQSAHASYFATRWLIPR